MEEQKALKNDPYQFYDDNEIEDLNTGENYSYDDTPATFGLIGGGLALLACLVVVGLMGAIYHRDRTSITLSHLIMACIGVLVAGMAAGICAMTKGALSKRMDPNHTLIGVALVLALIFFGYFLASSVYIFMYRPFHYAFLIKTHNNTNDWKDTFDDWSFDEAWGEDRRIIWWVAFFSVVATLGFLIASICLWLLSKFHIQSAKMCLGAACFAGVVLGCFAIDYLWTARKFYSNYVFKDMSSNLLTALLILLIISVALLFLNAIINIFKKRSGHFMFGSILIICLFVLVCVLGLVLRDLRKRQFNQLGNNKNCSSIIDSLHQDDIKSACAPKYTTQTCSKQYLVSRWETDKKPAFINPSCCHVINNYMLWPLYIAGCLALLMITAILVVIAFNFYLSDKSEYLEFENSKIGLMEIVFAALCVLALIAFGFYWGFRPSDDVPRTNPNNPDVIFSNYTKNIEGYQDKNFQVVDLNKVYQGNVPNSVYATNPNENQSSDSSGNANVFESSKMHTGNQILKVKLNDSLCPAKKENCGMRIAILAMNGKMIKPQSNIRGSEQAREIFYPDDKNRNNDFQLIYGNATVLNDYLSKFQVTPFDISKKTAVIFQGEQLDLSTLNTLGLKSGEKTSSFTLINNGSEFNKFGDYLVKGHETNKACYYNNSCSSDLQCFDNTTTTSCKKAYVFFSSDGEIDVKIPIKVIDSKGQRIDYPENTLKSSSYYIYNSQKTFLNQVLLSGSDIVIKVPKPIKTDLNLMVNLYDTSNHYLPLSQNYSIPVNSANPYKTDEILLLTKNGKGCKGATDENACWANQKVQYTNVDVNVKDENSGDLLKDIKLKLHSGLDTGSFLGEATTDKNGFASFTNAAYDYYNLSFEGNEKFLPAHQNFIVQSEVQGDTTLFLHRRDSTTAVIEEPIHNQGAPDQDLALSIRSIDGKECTVDPLNKWCAYAEHSADIQKNKSGFEKIKISKFTVSHYLAYKKESPAYSGSCPAEDSNKYKYYKDDDVTMRSLEFNWEEVRDLATTNYQTLYCFTGWGLNSKKTFRVTKTGTDPSANDCVALYPSSSKYNLTKLKDANNK